MSEKVSNLILAILVFLIPLFFLPLTSGFYGFNKNILLYLGVTLLLLNLSVKSVLKKEIRLIVSSLDLYVFLFALSFLVSFLIQTPNKKEALLIPGGPGTILALTLLYFLLAQIRKKDYLLNIFLISSCLLAVSSLFFFLEWWKAWGVSLPSFLAQKSFSPTGGLLPQAMFLAVALLLVILKLKNQFKKGEKIILFYYLLGIIFLAAGLAVSVYQLFTTQKPAFLPYSVGWAIAVETFKNLKTALFGLGPTNFLSAFTRFKPLRFNRASVWNLRFASSSNWYFHLLAEAGLVGFVAYLFLVYKVFKTKSASPFVRPLLLFIFLIQLFLPANFLLLFILFVLLGLYTSGLPQKELVEESQVLPWVVLSIAVALLGFASFFVGRAYAGEIYFKRSLDALRENKGVDVYNLQIKALTFAPYNTRYRLAYSQTNFALANAIAQRGDLTDQDRAQITRLIQQAIREGKIAVSLNPQNVIAWENLAGLYRNLINFAQGADQWALATFAQAIALDPLNPNLRIALGGVYYSLGNFDEAERIFRIAIDLKPDLANAHYNLAAALREKKEYQKAAQEMQITLSLVEPNTNDFERVSKELEDLRAKLPQVSEATPSGQPETLTPPTTPPAGISPPLELGEEAKPALPGKEVTPSPAATPTITP